MDIEQHVLPDVKPGNLVELKAANLAVKAKSLPIGNGKYVKVSSYRKEPYVNIRDYAISADGQLYATKRGILLKPEEWKQLKKCAKEVDQETETNCIKKHGCDIC